MARPGTRPMPGTAKRLLIAACAAAIAFAGNVRSAAAEERDSFPALEELEREVSRLVKETEGSVVSIVARLNYEEILRGMGKEVRITGGKEELARRVGSGVVLDDAGHIVTTAAVVLGATDIVIIPGGGGAKRSAKIRGVDPYSGLAVLVPEQTEGLKPVRMAEKEAQVGALVTGFGNPAEAGPVYSFGFVSGTGIQEGPFRTGPFMKINAPTLPGAAGGPLFDTKGRLVGLLFGADAPRRSVIKWTPHGQDADDPESIAMLESMHGRDAGGGSVSFAVPVDTLRHVTGQLIKWGEVRRGWMGVSIESPGPGEVVLTRVVRASPAAKAGLVTGDRVVAVDGTPLRTAEVLVERIARSAPGDVVRLAIVRAERRSDVVISLEARPEPAEQPLPRHTAIRRPTLGVRIEQAELENGEVPGVPPGVGLEVLEVTDSSRAAQAGLSEGDVLVEALGIPLRSVTDLRNALSMQGVGQLMPVKILRNGTIMVVTIPPPPAPPAPAPVPRRAPRPPRPQGHN